MKIRAFAFVVFGLCLQPGLVAAEHKIHFSITEQTQIRHDQIVVQFSAQAQADNAQAVSQHINHSMRQGLSQLNPQERKLTQTGNYSIRPQYNRAGVITHWHGQQQLTLTLPINLDVSDMLSRLQSTLTYQSMQITLSHDTWTQAETELIERALKRYQAQAKLIAASFGQTQYKLEETHIQTQQPVQAFPQARMALTTASNENTPIIEAGEKTLSVTISGLLSIDQTR